MKSLSLFEKLNLWIRNSVSIKLVSIGILILLLLIPASMVTSLIREREFSRESAIREVSDKWGKEQTIAGPVLTVPYKSYHKGKNGEVAESVMYAHFLPDELIVKGEILPEIRYRGIYEVVVYNSQLVLSGNFQKPDFSDWNINPKNIIWDEASISVGVPDMRGIKESVNVNWGNETYPFNPGLETTEVIPSGISTRIPVINPNYSFSIDLNLNGSNSLNFLPLGQETRVNLESRWSNPSFSGSFLPDRREVTDQGFTAYWKVLHLNRNYPQKWRGTPSPMGSSSFGVNLIPPVNEYQKNTRSAKYAVMFIALTFVVFFFVEVLNKKRIHPFQYILVGLGLCIFYTLLLSLSEHISFNFSYIISAALIIGLITLYSKSIFKNSRLTLILGGILIILYVFMFVTIQLQDYALLMGSIGLLLVLGIVMYLSRKIDWYNINSLPIKTNRT